MGRRLLWSVVCLVPLFYLSMGHMMGLPVPAFMHRQPLAAALVQLVLCVPILILNRAYFTVGFSRLFKGAPNMDSLVALGAAAGLVYSLIEMGLLAAGQVTGMPDLYFESAGMILTLVTVGKYLEERSKGKTTGAITALLALAPDVAVVRRSGTEVTSTAMPMDRQKRTPMPPAAAHSRAAATAMEITAGTNTALILSARRLMGALVEAACSMS